MALATRPITAAVFAVVLLAFGVWSYAQVAIAPRLVTPVVLAGPDIGFRMQAQKGGTPVGQLVVRIDGQWRVVEFGQVPLPLGK
jgi:hypothetical protein